MSVIEIQNLNKQFGEITAVNNANFEIEEKEFVSILGPSGSGKSTILRMIAGFESSTSGSIKILGDNVQGTPPFERDINMVFQNLALFPHLTVAENIGYGLKQDGMEKKERRRRSEEMLKIVDLAGYGDRDIEQLSGGEQQRVALARALVKEPSVVLFDEPLASLDRKLRKRMQFELQRIQDETEITFLYVTHDQEVAMSVSDRMIVLNEGEVEQIGSPEEIYTNPTSEFVAQFIGDLNSVRSEVLSVDGKSIEIKLNGEPTQIRSKRNSVIQKGTTQINVGIRPKDMSLRNTTAENSNELLSIFGNIQNQMYRSGDVAYVVETDYDEFLVIDEDGEADRFDIGDEVRLDWAASDSYLFSVDDLAKSEVKA
jgi:spermidine/putrescine transport system ATP-binding protein